MGQVHPRASTERRPCFGGSEDTEPCTYEDRGLGQDRRGLRAWCSRVGAGRFEGYNLGYTGGSNTDADNHAIKRAATDQEVHKAKSRLQKKRAVAKVLNTDTRCWSYRGSTSKQQWDELLPPSAMSADCQIGNLGAAANHRSPPQHSPTQEQPTAEQHPSPRAAHLNILFQFFASDCLFLPRLRRLAVPLASQVFLLFCKASGYGWIPHNSSFGFLDLTPATLGVFASLDRF
jgi:hypothetical protein